MVIVVEHHDKPLFQFIQGIQQDRQYLLRVQFARPPLQQHQQFVAGSGRHPLQRRVGPLLLGAVAAFGAGTIVFGLSHWLPLSLGALVVMGAADMVSVVIRISLMQLETPDEMRGRVGAVNSLFVGASNQIGEFESGLLAAWLGAVPAVVLGGVGTLVVVALWWRVFPLLARRDRLEPD